ncbi:hypothetical protein K402DRAFT_395391 [Aulographum hederae CBS 113979]|uniref:Uncharacterized protein n=1 Tax=Aulographum hederae CBS 113979 TaxID=1176131 RepID=A0A6G1GV52_9PEZI|nr:hypothetical protein K402DRAFT_395391 [Aulographum hederae CBS 113979]
MPTLRNPFKKTADTTAPPSVVVGADPAAAPKPIDIVKEPTEYKLSEIDDSGCYLPPSPTEKKSFWGSRSSTSSSSGYRNALSENSECFSISRESFDSYRRSFDISARSPIPDFENQRPRQSLDAHSRRHLQAPRPRASLQERRIDRPDGTAEDGFEEVGLNDDVKPKKKGLFGFGHVEEAKGAENKDGSRPTSSHQHFQFLQRKRGASGRGEELRSMPRGDMHQANAMHAPEVSAES